LFGPGFLNFDKTWHESITLARNLVHHSLEYGVCTQILWSHQKKSPLKAGGFHPDVDRDPTFFVLFPQVVRLWLCGQTLEWYPLHIVVVTPCLNLYTRHLPWLGLKCGVSRCAAPVHLLPRFLLALTVLIVSSVHLWSRCLSFERVGLWSATKGSSRAQPECVLPEAHLVSQSWRALLGGHRGTLVPFLPQWGAKFLGRYVSW